MPTLKVKLNGKSVEKDNKNKRSNNDQGKNIQESGNAAVNSRLARLENLRKQQEKQAKQQKTKSKFKRWLKRIFMLLIVAAVAGFGYVAYYRWQRLQKFNNSLSTDNPQVKVCDNIIDPKCWTEAFKPQLEQKNGITGVLVVGLDTREKGGVNAGVMNTDSIMVVLYNHQTKKATMISLPRDLWVPYYINGKGPYYQRINAIYAMGENSSRKDGMKMLEETVERITGEQIQYHVLIKLEGVEQIVDKLGGVDVEVEKNITVNYPNDYPGQNGKPNVPWLVYTFKKGTNHLDGEHALVWSRFRHVLYQQRDGTGSYASDFSRGRRQQQVIDGIKVKVLADEGSTLDKAQKYWDMLQSVNKYTEFNVDLEDIFAGLTLANEADLNPINVVMDPNFGGLNTIIYTPPMSETGGVSIIKFKDSTFKTAQAYLDKIWKNPKLYDDNAKIAIVNNLGRSITSTDKISVVKNEYCSSQVPVPCSNIKPTVTGKKGKAEGIIIIDFSGGKKSGTTQYLANKLGAVKIIEDPKTYGYKQTKYSEDIQIVLNPAVPAATTTTTTTSN